MGYTHHDKVDAVNGFYVGAKGSEKKIADTTGVYAGTAETLIATSNGLLQAVTLISHMNIATTAADTGYVVTPIAGTVSSYICFSQSAGTGRQCTVTVGSAGAILMDTGVLGVTGTPGTAIAMTNSSGTTTVSAGQSMLVSFASCATAQYPATCVITVTRSA